MRFEPAYYPLLRIAINLGCALLGFAAMVLVGVVLDAPIRAGVDAIQDAFGTPGMVVFVVGGIGSLSWWAWSDNRRDERRQIAETGTLEHRRPVFVREGLGRNVLILVAPLAILVAVGLALWLSGTPFPASGP